MPTANWDFQDTIWELAIDRYISAPSALKQLRQADNAVLSRLGHAYNLFIGGIDSWLFRATDGLTDKRIGLLFRNQAFPPNSNLNNTYLVRIDSESKAILYRREAEAMTYIGEWNISWPATTWKRYMVTWWNGYNPQNTPCLVARLQEWDGAAWLDKGELYDVENKWADSGINRCGLYLGQNFHYADDTIIWIPQTP